MLQCKVQNVKIVDSQLKDKYKMCKNLLSKICRFYI